jgi:polysaccharide biosynthesis transport protein
MYSSKQSDDHQPMELTYFFGVLNKRKWLLLLVALTAAGCTYYFVNKMPYVWKSGASISTGITSFQTVRVGDGNVFTQEYELNNKFANLIEYMKSRPSINQLTKKLVLHDLKYDSLHAFRRIYMPSTGVTTAELSGYLNMLEHRTDSMGIVRPDTAFFKVANQIEKALGYDYETLAGKLDIKQSGKSDYLKIEYAAETAELSYFVVKSFCDEFLKYYYASRGRSTGKSVAFYDRLVSEKKRELDSLNNSLTKYSKDNEVVALVEQSQAIVTQIKDLEMVRNDQEKQLAASKEVLATYKSYDRMFTPITQDDYSKNVMTNDDMKRAFGELERLQSLYLDSGLKDENLKKRIADKRKELGELSKRIALARREETDPLKDKQKDIFMKSVDAESDRQAAEKSLAVINGRIAELRTRKMALVNNNADIRDFHQKLEVVKKEYDYAVDGQNRADIVRQSTYSEEPMKITEPAMPATHPERKNRRMLSAFAAVAATTIIAFVLFVLTYFDSSLTTPFQYTKQTGLPLLGVVNKLPPKLLTDFNNFFDRNTRRGDAEHFKEALRRIRHAIEGSGAQSFLFVSPKPQEGKSFLIGALAHSLMIKNKKVLIIDTNFKNNTLTGLQTKAFLNNPIADSSARRMPGTTDLGFALSLPKVDIIGNKGGHNSPSELLAGTDFRRKVEEFKKSYDYIFLESAAMNSYSDARELIDFADKVVCIFDANTALHKADKDTIDFLHVIDRGEMLLGGILNKAEMKNI